MRFSVAFQARCLDASQYTVQIYSYHIREATHEQEPVPGVHPPRSTLAWLQHSYGKNVSALDQAVHLISPAPASCRDGRT